MKPAKVQFVFDARTLQPIADLGDGWDVIQVGSRKLLLPRRPPASAAKNDDKRSRPKIS